MSFIQATPAFPVHNIDIASDFYELRMGFKCQYKNNGFAKLTRDNVELHLWAACDNSWKWRSILFFLKPIWSGAESFIAGTHSCRIEVRQIDELYEELKEKKVLYNPQTVIEETDWGTMEFPARDLHGNLITFYERLFPA